VRNTRLQELIKINRGSQIRQLWEATLEQACGLTLKRTDFIGIDETLQLKEKFFDRVKSRQDVVHLYYQRNEFDKIQSRLKNLARRLGVKPLILFSSTDKFIGAIRAPAVSILENAEAVWEVVGEDLSLTSSDVRHGLCLERNYYGERGRYVEEGVYEITAWGDLVP
jgi:hypothetical protein